MSNYMINYKNYTVNGINVHYPSFISKYDDEGKKRTLTESEKLCDLIDSTISMANHNLSRMDKLHREYKGSSFYFVKESNKGDEVTIDPKDEIYIKLLNKMQEATSAVYEVKNLLSQNDFNTYNVKACANKTTHLLHSLEEFTHQNLDKINLAFEKSPYDTDAANSMATMSMLLGPIGFLGIIANAFYNNEFDGKVTRAHDESLKIETKLTEIGEIISHYSSDIYL